jgi:Arc/MetJ family transcription regulator
MIKRTTIEIDEELLGRAKRALGQKTTRATVDEALRRVTLAAEGDHGRRAALQQAFLDRLGTRIDVEVLASGEMWR